MKENKNLKSHSEVFAEVSDERFFAFTQNDECGRSMVEMLGVLAIMGVLSVAGIQGYANAMNRYKANELLNETSMRAVSAAMEITAGKTPSDDMIEDFTDPQGYTFNLGKKNDKQFYIKISGVSNEVCEQMKKMSSDTVRDISECPEDKGFVVLSFNNDLTDTPNLEDNDGKEQACKTAGGKYCPDGKCIAQTDTCTLLPSCPDFASDTYGGEYTGGGFVITEGTESVTCYCPSGKMYEDGDCATDCVTSGSCEDNDGLCPGYYCSVTLGSIIPDSVTGKNSCGDSHYEITGSVESLGQPSEETGGYLKSPSGMYWNSAVNYCQALKKAIDTRTVGYTEFHLISGELLSLPEGCYQTNDRYCPTLPAGISGEYWLKDSCNFERGSSCCIDGGWGSMCPGYDTCPLAESGNGTVGLWASDQVRYQTPMNYGYPHALCK